MELTTDELINDTLQNIDPQYCLYNANDNRCYNDSLTYKYCVYNFEKFRNCSGFVSIIDIERKPNEIR